MKNSQISKQLVGKNIQITFASKFVDEFALPEKHDVSGMLDCFLL